MEFLPKAIQAYCNEHTDPEPPLLKELNRRTHIEVLYSRMLSGHFQGRLLSFVSKLIKPKIILEVGTYTGYSALCLAEGLAPDGTIFTIEVDPEFNRYAKEYAQKAGVLNQIKFITGDALQILPTLDLDIDLVFLDGNKEHYQQYYDILFSKIVPGGLIIVDNILWSGQVVDKSFEDKATESLRKFNNFVLNDSRVEKIMLPVRDGLYFIRKL